MNRQRALKHPVKPRWFSWSRAPDADGCMYRLFRREGKEEEPPRFGVVHARFVYAHKNDPHEVTIRKLRIAYKALRDEVDECDLMAMEMT